MKELFIGEIINCPFWLMMRQRGTCGLDNSVKCGLDLPDRDRRYTTFPEQCCLNDKVLVRKLEEA